MSNTTKTIRIEADIQAPIDKVWNYWTSPEHICRWNNASDDWHTPRAEVDLRPGGKFLSRMEAKDGSFGFDFWGIYDEVAEHTHLAYTLGDKRKVRVLFDSDGTHTLVVEEFEPENQNSEDLQRNGWQAILNNFKAYCESH